MYSVTITDANNCSIVDSVSVGSIKTLTIDPTVTAVTCNGLDNGSIFLQGETFPPLASQDLPYIFTWTGITPGSEVSDAETSRVDSLAAGSYTVRMEDQIGCSVTDSFTIVEPEALLIEEDSVRDETCPVGADGFASCWLDDSTELDLPPALCGPTFLELLRYP